MMILFWKKKEERKIIKIKMDCSFNTSPAAPIAAEKFKETS